MNNFRGRVSKF